MARAISMAESGLNAGSIGDTTIQYYQDGILYGASYGCFQIRYLPGRPSPDQLLDPVINVQYAYTMQKNQGWKPWSVYTNGKYMRHL